MQQTILTVMSDPLLRANLSHTLVRGGFHVIDVLEPRDVQEQIRRQFAELVVASLPEPRLLELCRDIRRHTDVPVLVQLPELEEQHEWMCFQAGANDVVPASVSKRVLLARIEALLRDRSVTGPPADRVLHVGPLTLDLDARQLFVLHRQVPLTRTEFDLLAQLMSHPRRVHVRGDLVHAVWGGFQPEHVLETHLCRLRKKIREVGGPNVAEAVRGVGYRLGIDTRIGATVS